MDEEDEKKQENSKKRREQFGANVAKIIRYGKYLANPAVLYALAIIIIIVLIIGIISFIISMPGEILGKIADIFNGLFGHAEDELKVTDEEILDLAKYIEDMGYDLEGYGFVEEITLDDESTYSDEEYEGDIPEKGEIKSIKSKYLKAYLVAEKKTYVKANKTFGWTDFEWLTETLETNSYKAVVSQDIFDAYIWPNNEEMPDYIRNAFLNMYEERDDTYVIKANAKQRVHDNSYHITWVSTYVSYGYGGGSWINQQLNINCYTDKYEVIRKAEVREYIREIIAMMYSLTDEDKEIDRSDSLMPFASYTISSGETMTLCAMGLELYNNIDSSKQSEWDMQFYISMYTRGSIDYTKSNGGMLWFETNDLAEENNGEFWKSEDGTVYEYSIEKENRLLRISTRLTDTWWRSVKAFFGISDISGYLYDLNNWTTKYGKPVEFLISVHMATQAPDFAYKLATDYNVDTKVHIAAFPSQINIKFVTGDQSDQGILELIDESKRDRTLKRALANKFLDTFYSSLTPQERSIAFKGIVNRT
ncbi:MAG: hypothetical protein IKP28_02310 [Clostridia bacterium]|nr:hypothetical protein [Clostridia bacterium]